MTQSAGYTQVHRIWCKAARQLAKRAADGINPDYATATMQFYEGLLAGYSVACAGPAVLKAVESSREYRAYLAACPSRMLLK